MARIVDDYIKMVLSLIPKNLERMVERDEGNFLAAIKFLFLGCLPMILFSIIGTLISIYTTENDVGIIQFMIILFGPIVTVLVLGELVIIVMFILARTIGGTGSFSDHLYHYSIVLGGILTILSPFVFFTWIIYPLGIVAFIYFIFLTRLLYKKVHGLGGIKATILAFTPVVLIFILMVLFILALILFIAALGGSIPT